MATPDLAAPDLAAPDRPRVSPFKFLDYFFDTEADRDRFAGRDREVQDLVAQIATTRTVVLFSEPGIGKTSLLLAGIFPELRRRGFRPVYARIRSPTWSRRSPRREPPRGSRRRPASRSWPSLPRRGTRWSWSAISSKSSSSASASSRGGASCSLPRSVRWAPSGGSTCISCSACGRTTWRISTS
jgi:hypothetical protein